MSGYPPRHISDLEPLTGYKNPCAWHLDIDRRFGRYRDGENAAETCIRIALIRMKTDTVDIRKEGKIRSNALFSGFFGIS